MTHSLTLGSLLLTGSMPDDDHGFTFSVLAGDFGFGVAQGVREVVTSLLADGELVRTTRYGNREVAFAVQVEGPSLGALAYGEAALRREVGRANTLTWQAPDVLSVPTVFDVLDSEMSQRFDDLDELRRRRTYLVTLTCAPFARSEGLTTFDALEVGAVGSTVQVDNCESTTGWTGTWDGNPWGVGTTDGSVYVSELDTEVGFPPSRWTLTRSGAVDLTSTPYLVVQTRTISTSPIVAAYPGASASGTPMTLLSSRRIADGRFEFVWQLPSGFVGTTMPAVTFEHTSITDGNVWQGFHVYDVSRTNLPPSQSPRQLSRMIEVGGTERTPGSLRVAAPDDTSDLALTLVSTWPDDGSGFSPPLRRWRTTGNTETTDAATFSGKREPMWPNYVEHDIPVQSLPDGTYQLMGLLRAASSGDYRVDSVIQSRHAGVTLGETTWSETVTLSAGQWILVPMGHYRVPIVAARAGEFRVGIKTPDGAGVEYDEAWLFPMEEDCALTALLSPEPHVWLDSPDLTSPVPQVLEGAASDKSDAHWPKNGVYTMGNHVFTPGRTAVFTATHGVDWPEVTLTYYKRWHSNAAEEG